MTCCSVTAAIFIQTTLPAPFCFIAFLPSHRRVESENNQNIENLERDYNNLYLDTKAQTNFYGFPLLTNQDDP